MHVLLDDGYHFGGETDPTPVERTNLMVTGTKRIHAGVFQARVFVPTETVLDSRRLTEQQGVQMLAQVVSGLLKNPE